MTFQSRLTAWPPMPPSYTSVHEDRCAADPDAPLKDWIYKAPAIGFVLSGWFDYLAEGRTALAAPGAIVLGNAGEHFNVRHHDTAGNKRLVVLLKQTMLDDIASDAGLDAPRFSTTTLAPGPDATRMYAWMRGIALGGEVAEDCEIALAQAALAAPAAVRCETISASVRRRALDAARYIEAHYAEPCGLAMLADVADTSRYQLARAFNATMGQSPIQYLINTRVRAAADVLRTTSTPITEVAFDVGFNDVSHFYYCFKSALGVTPRQWRLTH
ncbi:MAG: AraC family transcriptional regulator [Vitreimonas sp.]